MKITYRVITIMIFNVCFWGSAKAADKTDLRRISEELVCDLLPGGAAIGEVSVISDIGSDTLVPPKRTAYLTLEERHEKREGFLSLGGSYIAFLDDTLESLGKELEAILPLKRIALQHRLPHNRSKSLKLSTDQKETLSALREKYGIPTSDAEGETIDRIGDDIISTKSQVEKLREGCLQEQQRMERFLQESPSDDQWVTVFKLLMFYRLGNQATFVLASEGCMPEEGFVSQDREGLSFSERRKVVLNTELFSKLDKRIYLAYHCLPTESLSSLENLLQLPSFRMYINGYRQNSDNPNHFIKVMTEDGISCFMPEPFSPYIQKRLDLEYFRRYKPQDIMPDYEAVKQLLLSLDKPSKTTKKKPKKSAAEATAPTAVSSPVAGAAAAPASPVSPHPMVPAAEVVGEASTVAEDLPEAATLAASAVDHQEPPITRVAAVAGEGAPLPHRYGPALPKRQQLTERYAAIIAAAHSGRDSATSLSRAMHPQILIRLRKQAAEAYRKFYKLLPGRQAAAPFAFSELLTLMAGFRGESIEGEEERKAQSIGRGNGSAYILTFPVVVEKSTGSEIMTSRRVIHKPHPEEFFGQRALRLLKDYFEGWGLAPEQQSEEHRYVVWE